MTLMTWTLMAVKLMTLTCTVSCHAVALVCDKSAGSLTCRCLSENVFICPSSFTRYFHSFVHFFISSFREDCWRLFSSLTISARGGGATLMCKKMTVTMVTQTLEAGPELP